MTSNKSYHENNVSNSTSPIINSLSTPHHENANVNNSVDNNNDNKRQMVNSDQPDSFKKNADEETGKNENEKNNFTKTADNNISNDINK